MKKISCMIAGLLLLAASIAFADGAQDVHTNKPSSASQSPATSAKSSSDDESAQLLEGDKRFRTNCSRCHTSPHKLPPRMMATAIRHMRVRATLSDEDMRLILKYMTK